MTGLIEPNSPCMKSNNWSASGHKCLHSLYGVLAVAIRFRLGHRSHWCLEQMKDEPQRIESNCPLRGTIIIRNPTIKMFNYTPYLSL